MDRLDEVMQQKETFKVSTNIAAERNWQLEKCQLEKYLAYFCFAGNGATSSNGAGGNAHVAAQVTWLGAARAGAAARKGYGTFRRSRSRGYFGEFLCICNRRRRELSPLLGASRRKPNYMLQQSGCSNCVGESGWTRDRPIWTSWRHGSKMSLTSEVFPSPVSDAGELAPNHMATYLKHNPLQEVNTLTTRAVFSCLVGGTRRAAQM